MSVLNEEILSIIPRFFDGGVGPSHDDLTRLFIRFGFNKADPLEPGFQIGKMKRLRTVLAYALEEGPGAGGGLVKAIIDQLRAHGAFRESSETFAGPDLIHALRSAFRREGFDLDSAGHLRPALLENLEGRELSEALRIYIRRAQGAALDPEHLIGASKNLEEATARHVLQSLGESYSHRDHFPTLLFRAFYQLDLEALPDNYLHGDPYRAFQQAVFLLGCAVNKLRNAKGDGHGRPEPPVATAIEGRLSSRAAGLVAELLLDVLESKRK